MSLSDLRRVLEPSLAKGRPSRYLPMVGDLYRLVPGEVEHCDVWAFTALMGDGREAREDRPAFHFSTTHRESQSRAARLEERGRAGTDPPTMVFHLA